MPRNGHQVYVIEKPISARCVDGFERIRVDLKLGLIEYCVQEDFWALQYFPKRLDERLIIPGYDGFIPSLTTSSRSILLSVCEDAHL